MNLNTYPNPASTQLTIQTEIPQPVVTISDAAGNTIYRHQYTDNSTIQIPVADWVKGIYVVRIEGDGIVGISKVVIQ
ncbi:MAG TPA: T9SS type A sorting domain-containing protein [Chitinophagales bacterium]|nr:T9SS type A sorting domain-containing protein [Chitinophagales bacterium]